MQMKTLRSKYFWQGVLIGFSAVPTYKRLDGIPKWMTVMVSTLFYIMILLLIAVFFTSCSTVKRDQRRKARCEVWGVCPTVKDSSYKQVIYKDTIIYTNIPIEYTDSAMLMLYLECNEQNQVIATELKNTKGQVTKLQYKLKNGQLTTIAYVHIRDTIREPVYLNDAIKHIMEGNVKVIKSPPVNILTTWQGFQIWSGRIFWILIIIYILYRVIKKAFKSTWLGQVLDKAGKLLKGGK